MNRRTFLQMMTGATAATVLPQISFGDDEKSKDARPNIIIVLCDDLGYGDLGCYGSPVIKTPSLDRFASEGVRFTFCYAAAPNCSPARTGLLTGRTPSRVGMYDVVSGGSKGLHLREEEITVAELLKGVGYDTYHVGKWHLSPGGRKSSEPPALRHGFDYSKDDGIRAMGAMEDLIGWVGNRKDTSRPFFAYVALHEPHEPVRADEPFQKMYEGPEAEEAARKVQYGGVPRPEKAKWENRKVYFGCVSQIDTAIGRLMKYLDEAKLRDNTFLFFTSDNGPEHRAPHSFGSPGPLRGAKGHVYEGGIRVPGILRFPPLTKPGAVCDEAINGTDVLPTLCALTGAKVPGDRVMDGVNVLPALEGKTLARPVPLYWSFWAGRGGPQYAMRDGDWKILAFTEPLPENRRVIEHIKSGEIARFELYNLREDIGETTDLSAKEPERFGQMKQSFFNLHRQILAEGPNWDMEEHRGKAYQAWPDAIAPAPRGQRRKKGREGAAP